MTGATACEHVCAWDVVIFQQLAAHLDLVWRRLPLHVEYLLFRPDEFFGLAMTGKAPLHLKRFGLPRQRHQINSPVTGRASYAFINVDAVIEIDEVGQVMHARPLNRFSGSPAFKDRLKVRAVCEQNRVAIHAGRSRRNACEGGSLDRRVAIAAINAVVADVMLMAELHGLLNGDECLRVVGRALILSHQKKQERDEDDRSEYAHPGNDVRAAMKYLAHFSISSERESNTIRAGSRLKRAAGIVDGVAKGVRGLAGLAGAKIKPASGLT